MKIVSIDIEACGLDPKICSILEFGAVLDDLCNPLPLKDLPIYHCYFISPLYQGEPFALSMHPSIFKRIAEREPGYNYCSPSHFGNGFKKFLIENGFKAEHDRVTINVAGKNFGAYDLQILNEQTDIAKHVKIRHKILDPGILFVEPDDESLPGLGECKKRAGLPEKVSHTAVEDALDVVELIRFKLSSKFLRR